MSTTVFPYPGSKTALAPWIVEIMPEHTTYVEPFGGSAAVLVNKPPSKVEIYNDRDGDIYHFFKTLQQSGDELVEWLANVPYHEDLHNEWRELYYNGYRAADDVERAGQFFFLRHSQFACKYDGKSGFSFSTPVSESTKFQNSAEKLREFRDRLRDVTIHNRDYEEVVESHDSSETLFYFDPPYMVIGDDLYTHSDERPFDHERFAEVVSGIEGNCIVSYGKDIPEAFLGDDAFYTLSRQARHRLMSGKVENEEGTEQLLLDFNPEQVPRMSNSGQAQLTSYGSD